MPLTFSLGTPTKKFSCRGQDSQYWLTKASVGASVRLAPPPCRDVPWKTQMALRGIAARRISFAPAESQQTFGPSKWTGSPDRSAAAVPSLSRLVKAAAALNCDERIHHIEILFGERRFAERMGEPPREFAHGHLRIADIEQHHRLNIVDIVDAHSVQL